MGFDFGNINGMTKADFEAAIEYYKNKIAQMQEDDSINPNAKAWFLKRYNARLETLEKGFERLQEVINQERAKTPSVFVNEKTATISSLLGTAAAPAQTGTFENVSWNNAKHNWGQFFRILGAVLIPVVGTIPLTISAVKARRKRKAVNSILTRENNEIKNFANEKRRSYDAALASTTPFTEQEMQELLANPTELQRLTDLTNPTNATLNPAEKKILASKLATVRAYAQKNGYTLPTTSPLNNARFNTSADKIRANPLAAGPVSASTDLKDAHDKVKTLEGLKTQADALLSADPENDDLKSLVSTIDANIATLKGQAQAFVTGGLTSLNGSLTSALPSSTDEADIKTSNSDLDTAYNNKNRFGGTSSMTVAEARAYAEALGLDVSGFDSSKQKYDNSKAKNNTELQVYNDFDRIYANAERIVNSYNVDVGAPPTRFILTLDNDSLAKANEELNNAQGMLNQLLALMPNLPSGDSRRGKYTSLLTNLTACKKEAETQTISFSNDAQGYKTLKTMYGNAFTSFSNIGTSTPPDIYTLEAHMKNIAYVISAIESIEKPWSKDFSTLYEDAQLLSNKYTKAIADEQAIGSDLESYETKVNNIDEVSGGKWPEKQAKLEHILSVIDTDDFKSKYEGINGIRLDKLIQKAKDKKFAVKEKIKAADAIASAKQTKIDAAKKIVSDARKTYDSLYEKFDNATTKAQKGTALAAIQSFVSTFDKLKKRIESYLGSSDPLTTDLTNELDILEAEIKKFTTLAPSTYTHMK